MSMKMKKKMSTPSGSATDLTGQTTGTSYKLLEKKNVDVYLSKSIYKPIFLFILKVCD